MGTPPPFVVSSPPVSLSPPRSMGAQYVSLRIEEESLDDADQYASISIAFAVERILEGSVPDGGLRGIHLKEVALEKPWIKDYDAIDGGAPVQCVHTIRHVKLGPDCGVRR